MSNHNEIIRETMKYMPDVKLSFKKHSTGLMMTLDGKMVFINPTDTWERVKQKIDNRLILNKECGVCFEKSPINTCCSACANRICMCCHITLIIKNRGIHICPYCRISGGNEKSQDEVMLYVKECMDIIVNNTDDSVYYKSVREKIITYLNNDEEDDN